MNKRSRAISFIPGNRSQKKAMLTALKSKYSGNPETAKSEVERLMKSGDMSKEQFESLSKIASAIQKSTEDDKEVSHASNN